MKNINRQELEGSINGRLYPHETLVKRRLAIMPKGRKMLAHQIEHFAVETP